MSNEVEIGQIRVIESYTRKLLYLYIITDITAYSNKISVDIKYLDDRFETKHNILTIQKDPLATKLQVLLYG